MKELHYTFSIEYAEKYGLNEAIMLHNFIYWININKANNQNFINGKYWTYNSSKAFQKLFPFWTQKQIEYILAKLVKNGVLIKDSFNEDKRDRTAWYTLSDDFFRNCISQKKEMDITNLGNDISQKKEIIYITDKKQQIKNTNKNNTETEIETFIENYSYERGNRGEVVIDEAGNRINKHFFTHDERILILEYIKARKGCKTTEKALKLVLSACCDLKSTLEAKGVLFVEVFKKNTDGIYKVISRADGNPFENLLQNKDLIIKKLTITNNYGNQQQGLSGKQEQFARKFAESNPTFEPYDFGN